MNPPTTETFVCVVIPCFNEAAVLPLLRERLVKAMDQLTGRWEAVLVDDGSHDATFEILTAIHREDPRFKVVSFSRNFGHQVAVSAGLHHAAGEVVAVMDADLQDPPELLGECLGLLRKGFDVVYAVRRKRKESLAKRAAYGVFYRLLKAISEVPIPLDSGDFCLMTRRVVDAIKSMPERNIFVRGMRAWTGFRQVALEYERDARAAGETKYPFTKLCRLAADGVFSFSILPLRIATWLGFLATGFAVVAVAFVLVWRIAGFRFMGHTAGELPGWTAVIAAVLFLSGVQLLILGFMGEYIGRVYSEVKQRPRWVVRESLGFAASAPGGPDGGSQND